KYDQLLLQIKAGNPDCQIVICTICPRQDCNATEMNGLLKLLSIEYGATLVEMDRYFCSQDGRIIFICQNRECAGSWMLLKKLARI
ncbi:MAG: hypothetical protein AB2693_33815, partial [Candidatus Thiodiazotropha sp.]